ncbi:hypothetical protein HED60_12560 [Planctomycetales bacterium ZRK34]|nr:hypothetical protein HED60_12560 [Planctomycetales bacterium ZRK34]
MRFRLFMIVFAAGGLVSLTACEQRIVGTSYGQFGETDKSELADSDGGWFGFGKSTSSSSNEHQWTIGLGRFEGAGHRERAEAARKQLAARTGFPDLWVGEEANASLLYAGHYPSPQDKQARRDLDQWQRLRASGKVSLPAAMLVPITPAPGAGDPSDLDLRSAATRGLYTLQIGFYEDAKGKSDAYQKAAEQAATALRKDGFQAYYYHGPNRSMVTIGVFGSEALTSKGDGEVVYSDQVLALQRRFPYNLANGETIRETRAGKTTEQPSFLVRIPGSTK